MVEERLMALVISGVDAAQETGKLLENLPELWGKANLKQRREIFLTMLDGVYVDALEEKRIVGIRSKPAFWPLFEIATTTDVPGEEDVRAHVGEGPQINLDDAWKLGTVNTKSHFVI